MTTYNAPAAQRQHLTKVSGFEGYWATVSGGEITSDVTKVYDGGKRMPAVLAGPSETSDITVTRPWRPQEHAAIVAALAKQVGSYRTTISRYETDPDLGPIGRPTVYADALLVGLKRPEGDAASSDAGVLELTFAVSGEA